MLGGNETGEMMDSVVPEMPTSAMSVNWCMVASFTAKISLLEANCTPRHSILQQIATRVSHPNEK